MGSNIIKENGRHYHHLSDTDVAVIVTKVEGLRKSGAPRMAGMYEIARDAGCSVDTVYRIYRQSMVELMKPSPKADGFDVSSVEHHADAAVFRRRKGRQAPYDRRGGRLSRTHISRNHNLYQDLLQLCQWRKHRRIRQKRPSEGSPLEDQEEKYKQYTAKDSRGRSILDKPESINARKEFGHWEGDLVIGPRDRENGAYLTLIERTTRFYLMIPVRNKKQRTVTDALVEYSKSHPTFMKACRSITFDNGIEFGLWREVEERLGIMMYFGRPYHSCNRGSNENCNGLVRRFVRKGTDINGIDAETTRQINREINGKRRRLLGYESAEASFSKA